MSHPPFAMSPSYCAVVHGLRELHGLAVLGTDESPEADAIRDAMDGPWEELSEEEKERVGGLSEDLYPISHPRTGKPHDMDPQAQAGLSDAAEARTRGDWDRALALLRTWEKHVPAPLLSYLRGSIWEEAGDRGTAVLFYEHAARLDPGNHIYRASFSDALAVVDREESKRLAESILESPEG